MGNFFRFWRTRDYQQRQTINNEQTSIHTSPTHEEVGSTISHGHTHGHQSTNTVTENKGFKAVLTCHDKLVSALSPDPCTIAGILMANGFIPPEIQAKMLFTSSTPHEKATILVTVLREKIKIAPKGFHELMKILSELTWTKDIAETLQSAYQGSV